MRIRQLYVGQLALRRGLGNLIVRSGFTAEFGPVR
jgi:hypothetical protein